MSEFRPAGCLPGSVIRIGTVHQEWVEGLGEHLPRQRKLLERRTVEDHRPSTHCQYGDPGDTNPTKATSQGLSRRRFPTHVPAHVVGADYAEQPRSTGDGAGESMERGRL